MKTKREHLTTSLKKQVNNIEMSSNHSQESGLSTKFNRVVDEIQRKYQKGSMEDELSD